MLALQTDMSVPKDVNRIRLQVLVGDTLQHDQNYPVSPEPNGAKLPATLAIVAGESQNPTVQVRVIGIRGEGDDLLARTFAKVVTTVPTSRIATLRIPIQWLCDGTAREDGDGFASTCQEPGDDVDVEEERSCVAGECKPVLVDSALLPDYSPEEIFGGDPGPDGFSGVCFPTEECFDAGFEAVPNADCELELDVPDGSDVNVALQFPLEVEDGEGTGICGEEACYVPLDQDVTYGWSIPGAGGAGGQGNGGPDEGEGGRANAGLTTVKLPASVCDRVEEGQAEAVRVTYACQTKTPRYPTCGPWSAVEDPPDGGVGGSANNGTNSTTTAGGGSGGSVVGECASLTGDVVDTGDPDVDEYVSAVRQLIPVADQYWEAVEQACAGLLHQNVVGDLDESELLELCQSAADEVQTLLTAGALNAVLAEGYCVADVGEQQACEERCGVTSACGDDPDSRCAEVVGDCEAGGSCSDGCYGDHETPTECAGNCFGECRGSCSGRCTLADGSVAVEGCSGMCQGVCTGICAGNCLNSETCSTTCLGAEPDAVCGGQGANITCTTPLSAETCAEDLCAVSCEIGAAATRVCEVSLVSIYPSATSEGEPVSSDDRATLESNLGPLADVVLQTQGLDVITSHLNTATGVLAEALAEDPSLLDPEALVCFNEALAAHGEALGVLQFATSSAATVVNSFYFTDVSIPTGGTGGEAGNGGTGGTGGTGGSGGTGGEGAGGSSAGGSSGEVCVPESCTSDSECGSGVCPLGTCNLAQTDCSTSDDCPADFCDEAAGFTCNISGAFCEIDEHCYGRDLCSRVCDCGDDPPPAGGASGAGGTSPTGGGTSGAGGGTGGGGGTSGAGTGGGGGTSGAGTGGASGGGGTGGGGGASGAGGIGGSGGGGGSGGLGGNGGIGGSSGFGGTGGGSGGTGGAAFCGFGADPTACEVCLSEICCSSVEACDADPFCGPANSPDSQIQCVVNCQGGYGSPTSECEASCGVDGQLADATHTLLSCGAECFDCTTPPPID